MVIIIDDCRLKIEIVWDLCFVKDVKFNIVMLTFTQYPNSSIGKNSPSLPPLGNIDLEKDKRFNTVDKDNIISFSGVQFEGHMGRILFFLHDFLNLEISEQTNK